MKANNLLVNDDENASFAAEAYISTVYLVLFQENSDIQKRLQTIFTGVRYRTEIKTSEVRRMRVVSTVWAMKTEKRIKSRRSLFLKRHTWSCVVDFQSRCLSTQHPCCTLSNLEVFPSHCSRNASMAMHCTLKHFPVYRLYYVHPV